MLPRIHKAKNTYYLENVAYCYLCKMLFYQRCMDVMDDMDCDSSVSDQLG